MSSSSGDQTVRVAGSGDAAAIARLQVRTWPSLYGGLVPPEAFPNDPEALTQVWLRTLASSTEARNRVLVALDGREVVGFALTGPATDPDCDPGTEGELSELTVDAELRGRGHGSRLLQAAADTLVADRFSRAVTWVGAHDDALRSFLTAAGWAPDGARRELALGDGARDDGEPEGGATGTLKQVRLHTEIA